MYRQEFIHSSDIDSVWPCHFSILKASYAVIWISVRLEVQDSEVRHLWHCRIWPWPQWTVVEQYVSEILIQPCFDRLVVRYVDKSTTGFPLYRKDHLQTSFLIQFFTDLEFYFYLLQFLNKHWCPHCQASDLGQCIRRNLLPSWFERAQKSHAHLIQYL